MNRRNFLSIMLNSTFFGNILSKFSNSEKMSEFTFKYSICNEIFEGWSLDKISKFIRPLGYGAVEIAPYTLADDVTELSPVKRRELKKMMVDNGIMCAGLHWLLVSPKSLHITTADKNVRKKSWEFFRKLINFCADIGGKVMILGSPKQRVPQGCSVEDAVKNLKDGLSQIAPFAEERNVTVLLEPIARNCPVVMSMAEAVSMIKEINYPSSIQSMMDFHQSVNDPEPLDKLVHKYAQYIKHIHANELDGTLIGSGPTDFLPVFNALKEINFQHWISLEVFDFSAGPEKIAKEAMNYFKILEYKTLKSK